MSCTASGIRLAVSEPTLDISSIVGHGMGRETHCLVSIAGFHRTSRKSPPKIETGMTSLISPNPSPPPFLSVPQFNAIDFASVVERQVCSIQDYTTTGTNSVQVHCVFATRT